MFKTKKTISRKSQQNGATAVEFALILPIFLAIIYGGIVLGYDFFLKSVLTQAATNGVQAAIAVDPSSPNYGTLAQAQATLAVTKTLAWLPSTESSRVTPTVIIFGNQPTTIQVLVSFNQTGLFPSVSLPFLPGNLLPATLQGSATGLASITPNI